MTNPREPDAIIAAWLEEGPTRLPEPVRRSIAMTPRVTSQVRRLPRWARTLAPLRPATRLAATMTASVALVVGLAWAMVPGGRVGGPAAPSPVPLPASVSIARIPGQWPSDEGVAFRATVPLEAPALYWRVATYDTYALQVWEQSGVERHRVPPGDPLLSDTTGEAFATPAVPITVRVWPDQFGSDVLLSPGTPVSVSVPADVLLGEGRWLAGVDLLDDPVQYSVDAQVLQLADETVISGNRLRAAPDDYPADLVARYTGVPEGALGPDARDLLDTVLAQAPSRDPYDLAVFIRDYLRDSANFDYTTDVRDWPCDDPSAVECFARTRRGYCLHYASTMAILLRAANPDNPIPTRLVQGFLPGERSRSSEIVHNDKAHAWVEVYFPGYGWVPFDPTGGQVGLPSVTQEGPALPSTK